MKLRACLRNRFHCRSRREEAQISTRLTIDQSLLTSAPTIFKHTLTGHKTRNSKLGTRNSPPTLRTHHAKSANSQRGVALVVTLLMLSVVTVVAVAFLALSRRERSSVSQTINLSDARFMADWALERAKAQMAAPIMATTNMHAGDFAVSRSYINYLGFQSGVSSYTNVSYVYPNGK